MSDAEKLIGRAVELIETKVYGEAMESFLSERACAEWAAACGCDLEAVWEMAVWAVCELVPLDDGK